MMDKDAPSPFVQLSTATTWRGGEQQAFWLCEGLRKRGHPVLVVAPPSSPLALRCTEAEIPVATLPMHSEYDVVAWIRMAKLLRRERARLLHAHDAHGVTLAAFAARLAGGIPRLCTRRVDFPIRSPWKYRWGMDRVICISKAILTICREAGIEEEKLIVVPSGIDLARIQHCEIDREVVRREFVDESKKHRLIVLHVGSLTDHKGQRYLLEAWPLVAARLPQAFLLIVGEGELGGELRRQANLLALDEDMVRFTGFRNDVPALLRAADLFVMPSHLEGLCTSVMDAMAAGLAVVATTAGGLPELIEHERTGLLVPPRDPEALASAILDLLSDRKKRARLAKAAKTEAERRFPLDAMVEGTLAVYHQILENKEGPSASLSSRTSDRKNGR